MLRNPGLRKSVEQPVLDLNFAASQIGSNGAPDSRIDFSRGTNAWFVDSDGLVKKSPHNLALRSEDLTNGWSTFNGSVSANASASPSGEITADKFVIDNSATSSAATRQVSGLDDSVNVAVSVYLKAAGVTVVNVQFYNKANTFHGSGDYDLTTGTRTSNPTSGTESSIENVGNDWYRITFTSLNTGTGGTTPNFRIVSNETGDGSKGYLVWGGQLSQHTTLPVGNPYVKTEASAVYAARLDHDPTWFMSAAQEQNLFQYSEMLDDSYWTKSAVSVTANAETDPLGGTTAEYVFATSPSGIFPAVIVDFNVAKGVVHTLSFYAKKGERDRIHVDNQNPGPVFNENVISNAELTSEWQRFTGTFTPDENTSRLAFYFGSGAKTWSGNQGFYLWGLQVEVGSTASTYHRTDGALYYGEGATPKGLLIEEQRANLIGYSEDFSASGLNPSQSPGGSLTLTHNDALAPDGTTTATKLVANSSGGSTNHLLYKVVSVDNDTTVTASVFMKNAGQGWGYLQLANTGYVSTKNVYVDLENGVLGASSDSSATIEDYGNGWYRVSVTNTTDSDGGNDVVGIGVADGNAVPVFTGDDTNGIYIWGWQKEVGSFPTSYMKNTGLGATRNADVATMGPTVAPLKTTGPELITNGGAETGDTTGWTTSGTATLTAQTSNAPFGDYAFLFTAGGTDGDKATQTIKTEVGKRYQINFYGNHNSGDGANIEIEGVLEFPDAPTLNSGHVGWQERTAYFTATSTSHVIAFRERGANNNASIYVDALSVKEVQDGTELVTNGTFDTDTTGWTSSHATLSVSSNKLRIEADNATGGIVAYTASDVPVVSGRRYRLTSDVTITSGNGLQAKVYTSGFATLVGNGSTVSSGTGTSTLDFTATTDSVIVSFARISSFSADDDFLLDNISIRELYPFEAYNPAEGTYYVHSKRSTDANTRFFIFNSLADGVSPVEQMYIWHWEGSSNEQNIRWKIDSSGSAVADSIVSEDLNADMRSAVTFKTNVAAIAVNGGASSLDTSVTVPPIDKFAFGWNEIGATSYLNGHIKQVSYYPRVMFIDALKALTDD